jgi:hypothetical protein
MFPTRGDLHVVPFTDEALYMEQYNKVINQYRYKVINQYIKVINQYNKVP